MLNNNSRFCKPQEYDFYSISVPAALIMKNKRNRFLYSELVKRHPCFSDSCSFDSKLKLTKSGFMADVVVMENFRLADYKTRNAQRPVFVTERKGAAFFAGNRMKKMVVAAAAVLCLLLVITASGLFKKQKPVKASAESYTQEKPFIQDETTESLGAGFLYVADKTMELCSFEWRVEGFTESVSAMIKNSYPEKFYTLYPEATFSSVVFENSRPSFQIQLKQKNIQNNRTPVKILETVRSELRESLMKNTVIILEETVSPYSLKLMIPVLDKKKTEVVYKNLLDSINTKRLFLQRFSVSVAGDSLNLSMVFSEFELEASEQLVKALRDSSDLIFSQYKADEQKPVVQVKLQNHVEKPSAPQKKETKIGQMLCEDGTIIEFFKDENGKIIKREG